MPIGDKVNRREVLAGLSAVPVAALAGCGDDGTGNDGGDDDGQNSPDEVGERVPTLTYEYLTGQAGVEQMMEETAPFVKEHLAEVGIDLEINPRPLAESIGDVINDARAAEILMFISRSSPERVEPQEWLSRFNIENAGQGGLNLSHWANCEYSQLEVEQQSLPPQERREVADEALKIAASGYSCAPILGGVEFQAFNNNRVNPGGISDQAGIGRLNPVSLIKSEPTQSDTLRVFASTSDLERSNWTTIPDTTSFLMWNQLVYSPPLYYDENFELQNNLAEDVSVSDDGTQVTLELADATFHNGDEITAEHIQFTYQFINDNNANVYRANPVPYSSIDVIDDKTVEFNLERPFAPVVTRDLAWFGILYKDEWEEADGNPGEFEPSSLTGSGPFVLNNFSGSESMSLTPHDGHPLFSPDHNILFNAFREQQTGIQAFESGEIDIITNLSPSAFDQLRNQSNVQTSASQGFYPGPGIYWTYPMAPDKFDEFRNAVGTAINRQEINEVVFFGQGSPQTHGLFLTSEHPWHPDSIEHYVDDPSGDIEQARQVLEDAGWSWDDDGNLRYPPDADLGPLWPAEGQPGPDEFECVDQEGNLVEEE
jgi:peptide/nickel transport system substrate-binding protein